MVAKSNFEEKNCFCNSRSRNTLLAGAYLGGHFAMNLPLWVASKVFFISFFITQRNVIDYSDDKLIHIAIAVALPCLAQLTCAHHKNYVCLAQLFFMPLPPFRRCCVRYWLLVPKKP